MPGRILTLQRQVRELGRLRAGLTVPSDKPGGRDRPTSSKTWIATSLNRTYIEAAAETWGGRVEEWQPLGNRPKEWRVITDRPIIDAILPPGDPLSQAYEMWTGGGCQRRCDGEREQRSDQPCLCVAQFGSSFHEVPALGPDKKPQRCQINTRLSVFLPELPDIGIWRVETHGYWPSVHITGYVETIKALVGEQVMVPVTLGIDPKTKIKDGKTSHFIEIVVALKERASFGQILASPQSLAIGGPADTRTLEAGPDRAAIGSAPAEPQDERSKLDFDAEAKAATDVVTVQRLWKEAARAGVLDDQLAERFKQYAAALAPAQPARPAAPVEEPPGLDDPPADGSYTVRQSWDHQIAAATNVDELRAVWGRMKAESVDDKALNAVWWARKKELEGPTEPALEGEPEPDRDEVWGLALKLGGDLGWNLKETTAAFREHAGKHIGDANGWELRDFRDHLKEQLTAVPA